MRNIFLIAFTILTNFVFAQTQLSEYYDASSANRSEFSYNITVRIQKTTGATDYDTRYTATLVQASPDSKGFYNAQGDNKYYSCSQLGDVCKPNNIYSISIRLSYTCNGQQKADVVVFRNLNDVQQINVVAKAGGKFCESLDFSMEVMGAVIEPIHLGQIMKKIDQIGTTQISQNGSNNSNNIQGSGNNSSPSTSSTSSNTQQTINPNRNIEAIGQFVDAVSPMLDQWADNIQKRREIESNKAAEDAAKKSEDAETSFKKLIAKNIAAAEKGDENSQLILISECMKNSSRGRNFSFLLPKEREWLSDAAANKNLDAMNIVGSCVFGMESHLNSHPYGGINSRAGALKLLEEAAKLGSVDAMVMIGNYYNKKWMSYSGFGQQRSGADPEKAYYWYSMAAEAGSPSANYFLGIILRYGVINKIQDVKYKIKKNNDLAFKYFLKSVENPYYNISFFQNIFNSSMYGSCFERESFKELALMYEKGIGCTKDKEIAKKLMEEYLN
jgi:TPR repeat protein